MWVLLPWDPGRLALYMLCLSVSWFGGLQVQIVPRRSSPVLITVVLPRKDLLQGAVALGTCRCYAVDFPSYVCASPRLLGS